MRAILELGHLAELVEHPKLLLVFLGVVAAIGGYAWISNRAA